MRQNPERAASRLVKAIALSAAVVSASSAVATSKPSSKACKSWQGTPSDAQVQAFVLKKRHKLVRDPKTFVSGQERLEGERVERTITRDEHGIAPRVEIEREKTSKGVKVCIQPQL